MKRLLVSGLLVLGLSAGLALGGAASCSQTGAITGRKISVTFYGTEDQLPVLHGGFHWKRVGTVKPADTHGHPGLRIGTPIWRKV